MIAELEQMAPVSDPARYYRFMCAFARKNLSMQTNYEYNATIWS